VFLKGKEKGKQKHNEAESLFTEAEIVDLRKIVYLYTQIYASRSIRI
jgi:hypothetical protein